MGVPQISSVTAIQRNYSTLLRQVKEGPVFLTQRSKPTAVMLSIGDYEKLTTELKELRRLCGVTIEE